MVFWRGGSEGARGPTLCGEIACSLNLLGRMYVPRSPGTVARYMLPDMVGAGRAGVVGAGLRCGPGAERDVGLTMGLIDAVWGDVDGKGCEGALQFMQLDIVEARHGSSVGASLADPHDVRPRGAALRQSVMLPVIVRLWVASDTLAGEKPMHGIVWFSWRTRALRRASCPCCSWAGACTPACLGFLLRRSAG